MVHNFNVKVQISQKTPTPSLLGSIYMGIMLNFPKSLHDVECRDVWQLQMYVEL
jgi:hypothetical protein